MVSKAEYYIFREYSKAIKEWLIKTVYLSTYKSDKQPQVIFMTGEKAYAKIKSDVINGFPDTAYVAFILKGADEDPSQRPLGFVYETKVFEDNIQKVRHPMVYKLNYEVNIYTRLMAENDIINYQILSNSFKNHAGVIIVEDQWGEIYGEALTPTAEVADLTNTDRIVKSTINLSIPRAYVPFPVEEIKGGIIKEIHMEVDYNKYKEFIDVE